MRIYIADGRLRCRLPTSPPPTSNLQPPTSHLPPPTSHLEPPTSHLPPLTSNLPPPTSHLQLPARRMPVLSGIGAGHQHARLRIDQDSLEAAPHALAVD